MCVMPCVVTIPIQTLSDLLERLIEGGAAETTLQAITECRSHNFLFRDTFNYPPATTSWHLEQQRITRCLLEHQSHSWCCSILNISGIIIIPDISLRGPRQVRIPGVCSDTGTIARGVSDHLV